MSGPSVFDGFTPDFKNYVNALENQVDLRPTLDINRPHAKISRYLENNLPIIFRVIKFLLIVHAAFFHAEGKRNEAVLLKKAMSFGPEFPLSPTFEKKNICHSTDECHVYHRRIADVS